MRDSNVVWGFLYSMGDSNGALVILGLLLCDPCQITTHSGMISL